MRLNRRDFFLSACATAAASYMTPAQARTASNFEKIKPLIRPVLDIRDARTGEVVSVTFAKNGKLIDPAVQKLDWLMRDWRQDKVKPMDRDLFWALAAVGGAAREDGHSGEITFLSGYRTKTTNKMLVKTRGAAKQSFHLLAEAVDFKMRGVSTNALKTYVEWLELGGVGHYSGHFIHMDTGPIRTWRG